MSDFEIIALVAVIVAGACMIYENTGYRRWFL